MLFRSHTIAAELVSTLPPPTTAGSRILTVALTPETTLKSPVE